MLTYQDLLEVPDNDQDRMDFVYDVISQHKGTELYRQAVIADEYDRKQNRTIVEFQKLLYTVSGEVIPDNFSANFKMARAFFPFFVTQETQYLLGNGVTWNNDDTADRLGTKNKPFDTQLQDAGHKALVGAVSFGFFNLDHIEVFAVTEYAPLYDEENGSMRAGVRFWQVDPSKPLRATLYEEDGYTDYIWNTRDKNGKAVGEVLHPKRTYKQIVTVSPADGMEISDGGNYPGFPIVPLWANKAHQSELTGLREQIDCYDLIKSGFANTVDEASYVYWAIQNAGGMDDIDLSKFVERMKTVHAAVVEDDGARAEAHTMEAPYASRQALLERLERDIFKDAMALDVEHIASGATTATQIRAAYEPLNEKTDGFEYCVNSFIMEILTLAGIEDDPTFTRSTIINVQEEVQTVLSAASNLGEEYVTKKVLTLLGDGDKADEIIEQINADELQRGGLFEDEDTETTEMPTQHEVEATAEEVAGKALNGIQTQSLLTIIGQYASGALTEGQASQLISVAVGIPYKKAVDILRGTMDDEPADAPTEEETVPAEEETLSDDEEDLLEDEETEEEIEEEETEENAEETEEVEEDAADQTEDMSIEELIAYIDENMNSMTDEELKELLEKLKAMRALLEPQAEEDTQTVS